MGMHNDVIDTILKASPEKIVYVSCNPVTQACDIERIGWYYDIVKIQPVDMFPHTHHGMPYRHPAPDLHRPAKGRTDSELPQLLAHHLLGTPFLRG